MCPTPYTYWRRDDPAARFRKVKRCTKLWNSVRQIDLQGTFHLSPGCTSSTVAGYFRYIKFYRHKGRALVSKPRLLDLFCGAGGAGMGYSQARFEVVGVDIKDQPRYPFEFHKADALQFLREFGNEFDVIHASPPCQRYSVSTHPDYKDNHPDLIGPARDALVKIGKPYVIENVTGARYLLNNPVKLCGSMFGLKVRRHRWFEIKPDIMLLVPLCNHSFIPVLITGTTRRKGYKRVDPPVALRREAMQIDWMVIKELDEAIPPAYTKFIGGHLAQHALQTTKQDGSDIAC